MKITKKHLRKIIREAIDQQSPLDPDFMDSAEYDRGYQDGLDRYPVADNATLDYDAGYEDGMLDADIPEVPYDKVRSEDW